MQETLPQDHDAWGNIMLRYTKDERTQAQKARAPNPEHE